jgi:hypothetical protein
MKKCLCFFLSICVIAIFAAPGFAQSVIGDPEGVFEADDVVEYGDLAAEPAPDAFGLLPWTQLNLALVGFSPVDDGEWTHLFNGWGWRNSGGNTATCHTVSIPSGAAVPGYTIWAIDNNGAGTVRYEFYRTNLMTNVSQNILTTETGIAGTPGTVRSFRDIPGADHVMNNMRAAYWICINNTVTGSSLQSSGVTFWYRRQISPAPGSASFNDVPPSNIFFREIEALVRSGITVGCGGGNYCPNQAVTRGQMAAFLARALGLHWPDL